MKIKDMLISSRDQLLAQSFDAVLAVIVKLAGDIIIAKFLPGCVITYSKTPQEYTKTG